MTFKTSTTIKEQIDCIKKYGLLIQFKKLTVFQCVALIALLINFICCLLYHFYFFCAYDIFLFIGLMFYLTIRIRKNIKIPDSISSSSNLNLYTTIKIEITDKEIILILPNKTIIDNLTKYIEFIVIKNGILLITDVQMNIPWWRSHPIHENRATESICTEPCNPLLRATKSMKRATSTY